MSLLRNEVVSATIGGTYHAHVPANPCPRGHVPIVISHRYLR
jgi:hypothetical protein